MRARCEPPRTCGRRRPRACARVSTRRGTVTETRRCAPVKRKKEKRITLTSRSIASHELHGTRFSAPYCAFLCSPIFLSLLPPFFSTDIFVSRVASVLDAKNREFVSRFGMDLLELLLSLSPERNHSGKSGIIP